MIQKMFYTQSGLSAELLSHIDASIFVSAQGALRASCADIGEEVVTLIIDQNVCGEVFHFNLPDSFHSECRVFNYFNIFNITGKIYFLKSPCSIFNFIKKCSFF